MIIQGTEGLVKVQGDHKPGPAFLAAREDAVIRRWNNGDSIAAIAASPIYDITPHDARLILRRARYHGKYVRRARP